MPGAEMFTVLAVLEARDRISEQLERAQAQVSRLTEGLQRMGGVAEEAGAKTDQSLLETASGADAVELANGRLAAARDKLTAATTRQAEAERALLDAQASIATENELAAAAEKLAAAQDRAAEAAARLEASQAEMAQMKAAEASEDQLALAAQAVAEADSKAAVAVAELTGAQKEQAALVTKDTVAQAANDLTVAEKKAATASKELTAAERLQADTAAAAAAKTDEAAASETRFAAAASKGKDAMGVASKVALGAGVAVAAIGYESIKAATSFQTLTTRLVTTANESAKNLGMVRQGILSLSTATGSSADELAQSMYTVEAAGYHGAAGLDVLKASTEGAKLEGSDFGTVSNAVTDILKDYHEPAGQAANVTSQLVAAVSNGKANFQSMSKAMSNILPMAAAVHLKFSDVAGVLAEMTSHGVTAQRASQNIANAMRSLEKPTSVMTKEFKDVGINAQDVQKHLAQQGLGGTMQWLSGLAKENAARLGQTYPAALGNLMGTAAGLNVALMTTGENAGDTQKAIAGIAKASADAHGNVDGFSKVQATLAFKMDQAKEAIHNTGIAIGTALLPLVTKLLGEVNKILVPVTQWIEKHQKLVGLILTSVGAMAAAAGAIKVVSLAMAGLNAVMAMFDAEADASPIGLIVIALAALVAGLIYAYTHCKTFRDIVNAVFHDVATVALWLWHQIFQPAWNGIVAVVKAAWAFIAAYVKTAIDTVKGVIKVGMDLIHGNWSQAWADVKSTFSQVWSDLGRLASSGIGLVKSAIFSALGGAGGWLVKAGQNIISGLISGITSMIGAAGNAISSVAQEIKDHLPWSPAKKGPLSGGGSPIIGGSNIVRQLAQGIQSAAPLVSTAMRAATSSAAGQMHLTAAATSNLTSQITGSLVGASAVGLAGGTGGGDIHIHLEGAQVMSDRDMDQLVGKIGKALAGRILPAGGVRLQPR